MKMGRKLSYETMVVVQFGEDEVKHIFNTKQLDAGLYSFEREALKARDAKREQSIEAGQDLMIDIYNKSIVRVDGYEFPDQLTPDLTLIPYDDKIATIAACLKNRKEAMPKNLQKASGE